MDYIILDMEWNQPWPGSPSAKKPLPVQIRGEIIQIGAVRILEDQTVADEFQVLIKPRFYRRLNKENLALFQLPADWTRRWYNAQMMFNAQTDGSSSQKALKTALAFFQIPPSRPAHDALGDAYHTALICARLDLKRGIQEYEAALQSHENGFHGAELPGCLTRQVYYGLAGKEEALDHMAGPDNLCPTCGAQMTCRRWFSQPGRRYMALAQCPEHGDFLIRVRLSPETGGTFRVSRLTYQGDSEAALAYAKRAEKAESTRQTRRRRRRQPANRATRPGNPGSMSES